MADLSCPSCGGAVPVRSVAMPYAVCPHCQSLLMRGESEVHAVGTSATLPFDMSPLQVGTRGFVGDLRFEVVGRVRWGWQDGAWNEWLLVMGDGSRRWLGEAMGTFMLLTPAPAALDIPAIRDFARGGEMVLGTRVEVVGYEFIATDIKQATCLGGEGELPFPTPADSAMTNVDFRNPSGGALSVQRDARETSAWVGRFVGLIDLQPTRLRQFDDWAIPMGLQ